MFQEGGSVWFHATLSRFRHLGVLCAALTLGVSSAAVAQDGSFFTNDFFIEEDVMIEGAFDSGFVTETYEESVEDDEEVADEDEQEAGDE